MERTRIDLHILIIRQRQIQRRLHLRKRIPPLGAIPLRSLQRQIKLGQDLQLIQIIRCRIHRRAGRRPHKLAWIGTLFTRSHLLLLPPRISPKPYRTQNRITPKLFHQSVHPRLDILAPANPRIKCLDRISHNVENEGVELEEGDRNGTCELIVLEADGDGFARGFVEHVEEVGGDFASEGVSVEVNLIQIGMVIELGQGSGVRPRVGIVVVHGKGMQVAHVLDLFGQGSREMVLGERENLYLSQQPNLTRNFPRHLIPITIKLQQIRQLPNPRINLPRKLILANGQNLQMLQLEELRRHGSLEIIIRHVQPRQRILEFGHALHSVDEIIRQIHHLNVGKQIVPIHDRIDPIPSRTGNTILAKIQTLEVRQLIDIRTNQSGEVVIGKVDFGHVSLRVTNYARVGGVGVIARIRVVFSFPWFFPVGSVEVAVDVVEDFFFGEGGYEEGGGEVEDGGDEQ
mmetsp:Transcript_28907/g.52360  ORF Transcript_28907/g.52360 Transcript_28907/m.52360 type:complete len:458 (-) Transcript_28907:136-1509(-)